MSERSENPGITRRQFGARLLQAGWWSLALAGIAGAWSSVRFFWPRTSYSPPTTFLAGRPDDYGPGEVSVRFLEERRVWIVRGDEGIYALVARCSHLGCRPNWFAEERRFKCPCHGSNFDADGKVIAGPAPRPLKRASVTLTPDGQILVDSADQAEHADAIRDKAFLIPMTGRSSGLAT
jgi:cytochrome b6-f complex iron-sulfur subunit